MEEPMKKLLLAVLSLCLMSATAFAGHVDTYGIGSRATAMAGAMTAGSNDPFSVHYNPAAMSRIKKPTVALGAHMVDPGLEIEDFRSDISSNYPVDDVSGNSVVADSSPLLVVPHIGYVHPINDKIALGFAVYVPYGLELQWNDNPAENPAAYNTFHSWYVREVITPSVSFKFNEKLSVGFGVVLGKSRAGTERVRYVPDFMAAAYPNYAELQGAQYKTEMEDDFNYSFNFGVLYEVNEKLALGLAFRSKSNTHMEGSTDVTPDLTLWTGQDVDASVDIDTPNQLQVGVEYKPVPEWSINFDVTRTWWGAINEYKVKFEEPFMGTADEEPYDRDWKDTFQYRIGTEFKVNDNVDMRFGYYYDPSVVPGSTFDVQWPDSDKHVFSTGVGIHVGRVTVDLVLQYTKIEGVDIKGDSENLNDTFTRPTVHEGETYATASGHLLGYGATISYSF